MSHSTAPGAQSGPGPVPGPDEHVRDPQRAGDHEDPQPGYRQSAPWSDDDLWNHEVRDETPLQRVDRQYSELLQEVRVAQTGVQFLLAFLLTVAFTPRFGSLTPDQKLIYVITLLLGAGSTALLMAPVSFHRIVFGRHLKRELVMAANRLTLWGLTLLVLTLSSALLLIFDVVFGFRPAVWLALGVMAWFALWWYALPLWHIVRSRHRHGGRHQRAHRQHQHGH